MCVCVYVGHASAVLRYLLRVLQGLVGRDDQYLIYADGSKFAAQSQAIPSEPVATSFCV